MSNTVDKKVVEMQFNNAQFESGVKTTMTTLEKLKAALNFSNTQTGVEQIQRRFDALNFESVIANVDYLANRFSVLGIAGMTAIQNITNRVIDLGATISNKVLNQIKQGGINRYMNIAQAKFQIEGLKKDWDALYKDMDYAVDGTAYGIDEAARVAAQLSASGIEAGEGMKAALRGVSGVAAMTNSTYDEIGHIFTTIAGNGRLMGMQLTQLSTKGLNVAATLGEQLGKSEQEIRELVTKGEIDFVTFANAMDAAFGEHATEANKTFTGALSNMKAALSRIGENFARPIYENMIEPLNTLRDVFNDVKKKFVVFTGSLTDDSWKHSSFGILIERLSKVLTNELKNINLSWLDSLISHLDKLAMVINYVIAKYSEHGGLVDTLKAYAQVHSMTDKKTKAIITVFEGLSNIGRALGNVFTSVSRVINAVMKAFTNANDINDTAEGFLGLTETLVKLSSSIYITTERADKIYKVFKKVFDYIKKFAGYIKDFAISIGEILAPVLSSLVDILLDVTLNLGKAAKKVIDFIKENVHLETTANMVKKAYSGLKGILSSVGGVLKSLIDKFESLSVATKSSIVTVSSLLILGALFTKNVSPVVKTFKGLVWVVKSSLKTISNLSRALSGLSNFTKYVGYALIIKEIAIAVAIFAGSLALLSLVDSSKLKGATIAVGSLMLVMAGFVAMISFFMLKLKDADHVTGYLVSMSFTILSFAIAVGILAAAIAKLASADIKKAWNGVAVLVTTMAALVGAAVALSWLVVEFPKGSLMLIAFAASVYILIGALERLAKINMENIGEQLVALGLVMLSLIAISHLTVGIPWQGTVGVLAMVLSLWLLTKALNNIVNNGISYDVLKDNLDKFIIVLASLFIVTKMVNMLTTEVASLKTVVLLLAFAVSLTMIMKAFQSLVKVTDGKSISNAVLGMILIFAGISYLLKQIVAVDKVAKGVGRTILEIGVAILLISGALALLSRIKNPLALIAAVTAIGLVLYTIANVLKEVSEIQGKTHIFAILSMVLMVVAIAAALGVLTFLADDELKMLAAAGAVSLVLLTIAEGLKIISDSAAKVKLNTLSLLRTAVVMLLAIAVSLDILAHVKDTDKLYAAVGALVMTMVDMAAVLLIFSKLSDGMDIKKMEMFDVAVATLLVVATSMLMLNQFESIGKLYATVGALSLCLLAVAAAVVGLSKFAGGFGINKILAFGLAVASLVVIASAIKMLLDGGYDWSEMKNAVTAMIAVLGAMVIALSLLAVVTKLTGGVATLVAGAVIITSLLALAYVLKTLGESVKTLTLCLAALTKIDYEAIRIDILQELSNLLLTFGLKAIVAGAGLVVFGAGLGAVGVAMLAVSAALAIGVPMITLLIKSLIQLAKYAPLVATGIKIVGKAVAGASKDIANAVFIFLSTLLAKLAAFSTTLLVSIDAICNAVVAICLKLVQSIAKVVVVGIEMLCKEIADHLPTILKYLEKGLIAILKFLYNVTEPLAEAAAVIISAFFIGLMNGIEKKLPELIDSFTSLAITALWAVTKALYDHQDDLMDAIKGILDVIGLTVMNMLDTLTGGLLSKMDWYKGTMDELSAEIEDLSAKRGKREAEANTNAYIKETENSKTKIHEAKKDNILDTYGLNEDAGKKDANGYVSGYTNTIGNGKITTAVSNVPSAVSEEMKKHGDDISKIGSDMDETIAEGVDDNSEVVTKSIEGLPQAMVDSMLANGWKLNDAGDQLVKATGDGMVESDDATIGAEEATSNILGVFTDGSLMEKFSGAGGETTSEYIQGLVRGTEDPEGQSKLKSAVQKLIQNNVVDTANETLDVNSPSKVGILLGKYWDLGVGQGITEYSKVVNDASKGTANGLVNSFSDALNNVNKGIDGNLKYEPTIRPVVDMTQVEQASNWLQTAFSNDASVRLAEDSTLSIQNGTNNSLANQVAALSDQVNKLASTDYSKLLEGVSVNVDARTSVDGTPLRMTSAKYTSQVMNDDQRAYIMAKGGRI